MKAWERRHQRSFIPALAVGTLFLLLSPSIYAADVGNLTGTARIEFRGNSTLHGFEGQAPAVAFPLLPVDAEHWQATVEVPVASLDTGNTWRDEKMRAMFDADRFPRIRAVFASIDPTRVRPTAGAAESTLEFELEIRGVKQSVTGQIRRWNESSNEVSFDVEYPVSLAGFGLQAPSTLGVVRVDDRVDLTVHTTVTRHVTVAR